MSLTRSPLHERHVALDAKLADFSGWEMPIEYAGGGVIAEHTAVRTGVGLFDVSHLGKATVRGPGAAAFVNSTLTNDLGRIGPGQAQYTLCCDDATGGVVDDLIVYLRADDDVLLVPNAANNAEVVRRLKQAAPPEITVENAHRSYGVLAVQGPESTQLLGKLGLPTDHDYMSFTVSTLDTVALPSRSTPDTVALPSRSTPDTVALPSRSTPDTVALPSRSTPDGHELIVCRTGYTGEHGYELLPAWGETGAVWDALLAAGGEFGLRPCGLGARDTLRTEAGYPLHGHELSLSITPVQARTGWAVGWKKPEFWGRTVLTAERAAGPARRLWGLESTDRGIPRPGMAVQRDGDSIGEVTSGTFSPSLRRGIGLALIDTASGVEADSQITIDVRGRTSTMRVVKPPMVPLHVR